MDYKLDDRLLTAIVDELTALTRDDPKVEMVDRIQHTLAVASCHEWYLDPATGKARPRNFATPRSLVDHLRNNPHGDDYSWAFKSAAAADPKVKAFIEKKIDASRLKGKNRAQRAAVAMEMLDLFNSRVAARKK